MQSPVEDGEAALPPEVHRRRLRRCDLGMGLVLLALGLAMAWEVSHYPMTGSYGGVRNVWYVSPALFPLLVAGGIVVLAGLLLARAVWDLRRSRSLLTPLPVPSAPAVVWARRQRLALVVLILGLYIAVLIPRVDYCLATAVALLLWIGGFYLTGPLTVTFHLVATVGLGFVVLGGGYGGISVDFLTALGLGATLILSGVVAARGGQWRRLGVGLAVIIVAPLALAVVFKYFLLVPLPVEGPVAQALDALYYGGY
ncbi:MAG: hypothetical protein ACFCBW_02755 [Candidatus Competibacterales bacterium]